MQQQFETKEATERGFKPEEYREVVRRAQEIRREKEGQVSRDVLVESAAEVGIREEDLQEAERQLREEKERRLARQKTTRTAAAVAAGVLALGSMFSYNSLNGTRLRALEAQQNLQTQIQRRAELLPQVSAVAERGTAQEKELAAIIARTRDALQSQDVGAQLKANTEISEALQRSGSSINQDLMAQIEGSANRISVAQQRYTRAATEYNQTAQGFPNNLFRPIFGLPGNMPLFNASVPSGR